MKFCVKKISKFLLYFLPAALFFSYHPVISFGQNSYMNFDLSLTEIWLTLFTLSLIPSIKDILKLFNWRNLIFVATVPLYCTLSAIWSDNPLRTILTSGILWLILISSLGIIFLFKDNAYLRRKIFKTVLITATFVSVMCWLQCILDLMHVPRDFTLLCRGCTYTAFGFPHPNGFAIEPQFMGGLLIAPVLLCYYAVFNHAYRKHKQKLVLILLTLFLTTTLFITLSRGAIFSFTIGLIILFCLSSTKRFPIIKQKLKLASKTLLLVLSSFAIALLAEGIFAAVSPTNDTFVSGITKSIHQLSLGTIDLRPEAYKSSASSNSHAALEDGESSNETIASPTSSPAPSTGSDVSEATSSFSGYVPESTDTRLNLNSLALNAFKSSSQYILIGTGLGSAGIAMHRAYPEELGPKEIVQNEYVSILLELGLIGAVIITVVILYLLIKSPKNPLLLATLYSFAFSLLFFSGLPNAIYLYLVPVLFATAKYNFFVEDKVQRHRHNRH